MIEIRKRSVQVETVYHEGGPAPERPLRLASACAVVRNPCAGRYEPNLVAFMGELRQLGELRRGLGLDADGHDRRGHLRHHVREPFRDNTAGTGRGRDGS